MKKTFALILVLLLAGFLTAADKSVTVKTGKKVMPKTQNSMATVQDDSLAPPPDGNIVLLTSYVTGDNGEIANCISLFSTETLNHYVDYVSYVPQMVRFHFIWTGPEFYQHTTDWMITGAGEFSWMNVTTSTNWLPGTYKLVIIMESQYGEGGRMQMLSESRVMYM